MMPTRSDFARDHLIGAPRLRARSDLAETTPENQKHWQGADGLGPVSQNTPGVRKTLRDRARYEVRNNSFAAGLIRTLVADTVGTGPRLEMQTPDAALNEGVQDLWRCWAAAADWALTMRVLVGVRYVAGECFGVFRDSKRLDRLGLPVSLDLRLIEPDQVADPFASYLFRQTGDDGIECDADGEVSSYRILKAHPGDLRAGLAFTAADSIRAADVLHWFQPERPGQLRGTTPLEPALPIFAQLRRFTAATLTAAEFAAMLAGVLYSDLPADDGEAVEVESMDTVELVRGALLTVPAGWKAEQFKPEQPTTGYQAFVDAKLRECGRSLNVPFGKMAGDHSRYNYSSGRMDDGPYWSDRNIEREAIEAKIFKPFFYRWLDFARFALPALAAFPGRYWELKHRWHYDAKPVADPVKDASGDELNLTNGSDTLPAIAARDGTTEDELLDARAATMRKFQERGLPLPPWLAGATAPARTADGEPLPAGVPGSA